MGYMIRKLAAKAVQKAAKIDPSDTMTQINTEDVVSIIKAILF